MEFDVGGEHHSITPDPENADTNRARAVAAINKIAAAQDTIVTAITECNADLAVLGGSPTTAQVVAIVENLVERQRALLNRQSKIGDYLIAIIKFTVKSITG